MKDKQKKERRNKKKRKEEQIYIYIYIYILLVWAKTFQRASYFVYEGLTQASFISFGRDLQSKLFCKSRLSEIFLLK